MLESSFTIFEGPDEGRTFVVSDAPIEIGRAEDCDIVLSDDKSSRHHTRLTPETGGVKVLDLNSSNGTFVNGRLIMEAKIHEGDVLEIGNTKIVLGSECPSPEEVIKGRHAPERETRYGFRTEVMPPEAHIDMRPREARLSGILDAVASALSDWGKPKGVHVGSEVDLADEVVSVDSQVLYQTLAGLVSGLLDIAEAPAPDIGTRIESTLALRASDDPDRGGFKIDLFWIGGPFSRDEILSRKKNGAFEDVYRLVKAQGGMLEFLPRDYPDVLARLRLPVGATGATRETIIR